MSKMLWQDDAAAAWGKNKHATVINITTVGTIAEPIGRALDGESKKRIASSIHILADWARRDLARACVRVLYLLALEQIARVVDSLKDAGYRVIEEWPLANT